jgi:hypothetical protein
MPLSFKKQRLSGKLMNAETLDVRISLLAVITGGTVKVI